MGFALLRAFCSFQCISVKKTQLDRETWWVKALVGQKQMGGLVEMKHWRKSKLLNFFSCLCLGTLFYSIKRKTKKYWHTATGFFWSTHFPGWRCWVVGWIGLTQYLGQNELSGCGTDILHINHFSQMAVLHQKLAKYELSGSLDLNVKTKWKLLKLTCCDGFCLRL